MLRVTTRNTRYLFKCCTCQCSTQMRIGYRGITSNSFASGSAAFQNSCDAFLPITLPNPLRSSRTFYGLPAAASGLVLWSSFLFCRARLEHTVNDAPGHAHTRASPAATVPDGSFLYLVAEALESPRTVLSRTDARTRAQESPRTALSTTDGTPEH